MRTSRQNFMTGLVTLVAAAALLYLLARFGELKVFTNQRYTIEVLTNDAAGLRPGGGVTLDGVRIGEIHHVDLAGDATHPVRIIAAIGVEQRVPSAAKFTIDQSLLGGSSVLRLTGPPEPEQFLETDGRGRLRGDSLSMIDRLVTRLDKRLEPLATALEAFTELSETYTSLGVELGELVAQQQPGGEATLRTAMGNFNAMIVELRDTTALARGWLEDPELLALKTSAGQTLANADAMLESTTEASKRVSAMTDTLDREIRQLVAELMPVADQLSQTLAEFERTARLGNEGPGTVSLLLNNPELYRSLDHTVQEFQQTVKEARLLIRKFQSEGVPVRF